MACQNEKCGSRDVRKTEEGFLSDDYVCNGCGHQYTVVKPGGILRIASFALTFVVGVDLLGGFDGGGSS